MRDSKYIFVTGGVVSSLGKGILSASLGKLLQAHGFKVAIQKLDPYINIDPGTLNPYEHGECYVTDDGAETDLDLGHYERYLDIPTSQANNITTGRIYQSVIEKERQGEYLGATVQIIPHITDEIKYRIKLLATHGNYDFVITEIGGTVGDIESLPYIETMRQMKWELQNKCINIHLTLIPYISTAAELKTKPTQHSVKKLLELGVQPDVIVCRTALPLNDQIKNKIALFCNVTTDAVIEAIDADSIYDIPLLLKDEKLDMVILRKTNTQVKKVPDLKEWEKFLHKLKNPTKTVRVAIVGKYIELKDAYISISEAFIHAGTYHQVKVECTKIQSENINEDNYQNILKGFDGILVAPGFGQRGFEGKILSARFARENNIPFLGICLGMQAAVVEFARNVIGLKNVNSLEFNKSTPYPVIDIMESQKKITGKGGTMRLGAYPCKIKKNTIAETVYKKNVITERHRHRYEFNNAYLKTFTEKGMIASGINPTNNLVEIIEITNHKWFIGVQFHPEYKSTVDKPHPLFVSFISAIINSS